MKKLLLPPTLAILLSFLFYASVFAQGGKGEQIKVDIITDEADAVLDILDKKASGQEVAESDWQRLFSSEGYIRLKKRELSMRRPFEDSEFKSFVLSDALFERRAALADTLARWKGTDVAKVAELPLAYLPATATIHAKIYPVIKPRENSFVFDISNDPAIFLYLDPSISRQKFENTLAHELHHIGFGMACPDQKTSAAIKKLPENSQKVMKWIGAFGEGFAMLAAAGGKSR